MVARSVWKLNIVLPNDLVRARLTAATTILLTHNYALNLMVLHTAHALAMQNMQADAKNNKK